MATTNSKGRAYAPSSQISVGTVLEADGGFTCLTKGQRVTVAANDTNELYVPCDEGEHYLDGQLDDAGYLIGFYLVT